MDRIPAWFKADFEEIQREYMPVEAELLSVRLRYGNWIFELPLGGVGVQGQDLMTMFYEMKRQLSGQSERLERMEKTINELEIALKSMTLYDSRQAERIEYHFDQLKVEKLEGTLNIGLTPFASGDIKEMSVADETAKDLKFTGQQTDVISSLHTRVSGRLQQYLQREARDEIMQLERERGTALGDEHHMMMLADMERQLDSRIRHYISQAVRDQVDVFADSSAEQAVEELVVRQCSDDIRRALRNYFDHLPQQGKG